MNYFWDTNVKPGFSSLMGEHARGNTEMWEHLNYTTGQKLILCSWGNQAGDSYKKPLFKHGYQF